MTNSGEWNWTNQWSMPKKSKGKEQNNWKTYGTNSVTFVILEEILFTFPMKKIFDKKIVIGKKLLDDKQKI